MSAAGGINLKRVNYLSAALGGVFFLGLSVGAVAQSRSAGPGTESSAERATAADDDG